jgi:hypothetical protein
MFVTRTINNMEKTTTLKRSDLLGRIENIKDNLGKEK